MRTIRLTENDLHNIIKESVKRIINEVQNNGQMQQYQPQLVSRRMNNGQVMIFDPNRNQPVTNMTFDGAQPEMMQGHNSITAWKDNTNYEVYPNGQVQRINRF